jgi:hypothetical protein
MKQQAEAQRKGIEIFQHEGHEDHEERETFAKVSELRALRVLRGEIRFSRSAGLRKPRKLQP